MAKGRDGSDTHLRVYWLALLLSVELVPLLLYLWIWMDGTH